MNAVLARTAVVLAVHQGEADGDDALEDEAAVRQDDADELLEQIKALRSQIEALGPKVSNALRDAQSATVELHGVAGNPGLSQQVYGLRERLDVTLKALERELEASREHATHMLRIALDQQAQNTESLRGAIRSLELNQHEVRTHVDERIRDIAAEAKGDIADLEEKHDKLKAAHDSTATSTRARNWSLVLLFVCVSAWAATSAYQIALQSLVEGR